MLEKWECWSIFQSTSKIPKVIVNNNNNNNKNNNNNNKKSKVIVKKNKTKQKQTNKQTKTKIGKLLITCLINKLGK